MSGGDNLRTGGELLVDSLLATMWTGHSAFPVRVIWQPWTHYTTRRD